MDQQKSNKLNWIFFLASVLIAIVLYNLEKRPDLKFEIIGREKLIELKETIQGLSILYNQIELKNNDITVLKIHVRNEGNESVSASSYDALSNWGLKVINGKLIQNPIIEESSDSLYFNKNLIKSFNTDSIIFNRVIINKKDYFILKFYLVHNSKVIPTCMPFGKIDKVRILNKIDDLPKKNARRINILYQKYGKLIIYTCILFTLFFIISNFGKIMYELGYLLFIIRSTKKESPQRKNLRK